MNFYLMAPNIFHRRESPTQTHSDAQKQEESGWLMGSIGRYSHIPKVRAYIGPLPNECRGIEFTTEVEPDRGSPPGQACWSGEREGVLHSNSHDFVMVKIQVLKNTQK